MAILALGVLSLAWSREIFQWLMRPVLAALPPESRSLIYTSGIEELNVLLKVGLYAGIFLGTPVILYQLWMFVAPGLLKTERKAVGPFVLSGTVFFIIGALFCYLVILPTMFKFLLNPGEGGAIRDRIALARSQANDATRLFFLGDSAQASHYAQLAQETLSASGSGKISAGFLNDDAPSQAGTVELSERSRSLEDLLDHTIAFQLDENSRQTCRKAISLRNQADLLLSQGLISPAAIKIEEAINSLEKVFADHAKEFRSVWHAHSHLAFATAQLSQKEWTRPMLSMKEQLSLVLMLEIAFGAIFELPLLMGLLATLGILQYRLVARYQRHAILVCVVLAAVITPTSDAVNLALMAVPMIVCFEIGVLLVWVLEKRKMAQETAQKEQEPT